jgi:hypothetical protein
MQGKMGIETRNIIRDSKKYHIMTSEYVKLKNESHDFENNQFFIL